MLASSAEDVPIPLLSRLIEAMRPEQIWLFGSRARGEARPTSDWDLLVVLPNEAPDDELDLVHAWQAVRDLRIPADVITVRWSEFEEARHHAGTLVRTVVGEGRRIYARDKNPLDRLRAAGAVSTPTGTLDDLPPPLPLAPGQTPPSIALARLRADGSAKW